MGWVVALLASILVASLTSGIWRILSLLYEDEQWRIGYRHDVIRLVSPDQIAPASLVNLVRSAQGR